MRAATPPLPPGPFDVVYADPPGPYDFSMGEAKSVDAHYPTLPLEEICTLAVRAISAERSVPFLWVPGPKLRDGLAVVGAGDTTPGLTSCGTSRTRAEAGGPGHGTRISS